LEVQKNRTAGSNPSLSATQSEVQRNLPALLLKSREIAAISRISALGLDWRKFTQDNAERTDAYFLYAPNRQSGFNQSTRRMHCDHKPMIWRKHP
jgi:hypothetical protein